MGDKSTYLRLQLDPSTDNKLDGAKNFLRSNSCPATKPKVAEWALKTFFEKYFQQEKKNLESSFFDEKAYLKKLLEEASSKEELSSSLKELIGKMNRSKSVAAKSKKKAKKETLVFTDTESNEA